MPPPPFRGMNHASDSRLEIRSSAGSGKERNGAKLLMDYAEKYTFHTLHFWTLATRARALSSSEPAKRLSAKLVIERYALKLCVINMANAAK